MNGPITKHRLRVDATHELQIYEYGKPTGVPIVFLHGGPGTGIFDSHYDLFNPELHRVFLFDQRGCGQSTPLGSLINNTTWELVSDIEKIRTNFKIPQWFVVGGSWGSALGLSYSMSHPSSVIGGVFWAITELSKAEILDMLRVFPLFYPDRWEAYIRNGGEPDLEKLIAFEYKELLSESSSRIEASIKRSIELWSSGLTLSDEYKLPENPSKQVIPFFFHYSLNEGFFDEYSRPLARAQKLALKPIKILHGRQDMRCFAKYAYQIHKAIPGSEIEIVSSASHGAFDPPMAKAIKKAIIDTCI
jgi:proline iminopeptidase